jgi:hypothetical protein
MELKLNLEALKEKVVKYMTRKQIWTHGYIRYNILKKMISFITKLKNNYEIRKLFIYLVEQKVFLKQKTKVRSYLYKFYNPNEPIVESKTITLTFD